ncbi:MAG: NAD-dependent epimerase/dehydratase family protein [Candidatus Berkiellales bacterium]
MRSNNQPCVLITGATGFVGKHLCNHLIEKGFQVRAVGRALNAEISHAHFDYRQIENMDENTCWDNLLEGVEVVVHLGARVHQMKDQGMQALAEYQAINVKGTQQLAQAAIKSNVKRFIYMSTIKVNGEKTICTPYRAEDQPRPQDAYSLSKLQGEQILQEGSRRSGMEWVIIRPPLVYGAFVKGNFRRLLKLAKTRLPLPFATVKNLRSFVSIDNLCSFIECCLFHPNAHGEVFLVSDNQDISLAKLIKICRRAQGRWPLLFPFPLFLLKFAAFLIGKGKQINRLFDSLQVNIEKSMRLLNWQPMCTVEEAIKKLYMAEDPCEKNEIKKKEKSPKICHIKKQVKLRA